MRNESGQVTDCFEVFPSLEKFYDTMMDLLTDPDAVGKLSAWVSEMRYYLRGPGLDFAMLTLYSQGVEFSITVVGKDYEHTSAGHVQVFAYS